MMPPRFGGSPSLHYGDNLAREEYHSLTIQNLVETHLKAFYFCGIQLFEICILIFLRFHRSYELSNVT